MKITTSTIGSKAYSNTATASASTTTQTNLHHVVSTLVIEQGFTGGAVKHRHTHSVSLQLIAK